MVPIIDYLEGGWAHYSWAPFGLHIEGTLPPESVACLRMLPWAVLALLIAWTVQRWEDYRNASRCK